MCFKKLMMFLGAFIVLMSCNKKCNNEQDAFVGKWTDNYSNYYFNSGGSYSYKYLGASSVSDTISVVDSAIGNYTIDNCQKVITLVQKGAFNRDSSSIFVAKSINFGTWKYTKLNDSTYSLESASSFKTLYKAN
jgi:hypothetical protein